MEEHSFGYWLRLKRKSLDLTREELAERVGYSAATIRKIEDEERHPSAQVVERLAEILHIPPNERPVFLQFATIHECSHLLEQELDLFPDVRAYLLMGDGAIKALNAIAKRTAQPRPIPAGPTYKIRGGEFYFRGGRCFPSYLQAGPSYGIEKSKQRMIAEDIAAALAVAEYGG